MTPPDKPPLSATAQKTIIVLMIVAVLPCLLALLGFLYYVISGPNT